MGLQGEVRLSDLKVKVHKISTVVPAGETEQCTLFMSNIDQVLAYYVETVYFYDKGGDAAVELLQEALGRVLVPYHFLAGRFKLNPKLGRMELECNREGVSFAAASCELRVSDLGDISVPNPLFRNLVLLPDEGKALNDAPLITIQVTKFSCGGFAMGVYMSHASLDGIGALEFFMNYCSVARGDGMQVIPKPDRTMLAARSPPQVTFDHTEYVKLSDLMAAAAAAKATAFTTPDSANATTRAPQKHVYKSFSFTPDRIAQLKKAVVDESTATIDKCSSFEVIVAHLWQARTRAVEMDPDSPSKLFFAVDIRNKVDPPLPKGFAGNGVLSAPCVKTLARDVRENSLGYCVRKVQEAIASVTDEYVRSSIDHGELYRGVPALHGGIFISPWWKIPFQELDFGWGRPLYAGPVVNDRVEFVLLLHNGKQDGGLNAYLALEPAEMDKFEKLLQV
ncbi:BAHD family acyltransferase, clade V [Selaginella moellendorffii]|uniref:BAHD family acyltransferase, clade V n=1 Tax=Selaginella moellendorffii TaxID=88036 RepID=D8T9Y4_SELML|nr:BAHD family acyltransferase, clade V [Selaginella moellendorffii]